MSTHSNPDPAPVGTYEFTEAHNAEFSAAAFWMGIMGWVAIVFGILAALSIFMMNIGGFVGGIISIVIGYWILRAAGAFRNVADTPGNDIPNVVEAVTYLKRLYRLQVILIVIYAILVIVLIVAIGTGNVEPPNVQTPNVEAA